MNEPSPFERLLADFAALIGADTDQIVRALEFEAEKHTVRVLPHPLDPTLFIVEVEVGKLEEPASFTPSMVVLDIPDAGAGGNPWQKVLLDGHRVVLKKILSVPGTSAHDLEDCLSEALDRAEELQDGPNQDAVLEPGATISNPLHFA